MAVIPYYPVVDDLTAPDISMLRLLIGVSFNTTRNRAKVKSYGGKFGLGLIDDFFTYNQLFVESTQAAGPKNVIALNPKMNTARIFVYNYDILK